MVVAAGVALIRWERRREFARVAARVGSWGGHLQHAVILPGPLQGFRRSVNRDLLNVFGEDLGVLFNYSGSATPGQLAEALEGQPFRQVWASGSRNLRDDWIAGLRDTSRLYSLRLDESPVGDRSVGKLLEMPVLDDLSLVATGLSDAGLERLWDHPRMRTVYLGGPNLRSVRLVEGRVEDAAGHAASEAGPSLVVRGRFEAQARFGGPSTVRVMVRPDGSPSPLRTFPYGWEAHMGGVGQASPTSTGAWSFEAPMDRTLAPGRARVVVWVDFLDRDHDRHAYWMVGSFDIDLAIPAASGGSPSTTGSPTHDP